jgi:hypothetical protein
MKSKYLILLLTVFITSCEGSIGLTGKLVDSKTKKSIVGAKIEVLNAKRLLIPRPIEEISGQGKIKPMVLHSDSVGRFEIKSSFRGMVFPPKVKLRVRHTYYKTKKFKGTRFNTIELVKIDTSRFNNK